MTLLHGARARPGSGDVGAGAPPTAAWAWSGLVALVGLIWVVYVHPIAHLDLEVFLGAGASVADGRDPYPVVGTPSVYSGFSFVYPYLVAWPFVPLSWLPHPVGAAVFVALSVLAVLAGCRLLAPRTAVSAPVLAASWTITGLQMGTLNALLFLGLAALWRYRDRPVPAGLLAAALVVSKLFLWPLWLWLLLTGRARAAAAAVGATAVVLGAGWLVGPLGAGSYLAMLSTLGVREAPAGLSLTGLLMNAGAGAGPAQWLARLAAVGVVVVARQRVRRDAAHRTTGGTTSGATGPSGDRPLFAAGVAAALVASPIVWSHYLLLLAVPLLAVDPDPPVAAAVFAVGSWLLVTPHGTGPVRLVVGLAVLAVIAAVPLRRLGGGLARRWREPGFRRCGARRRLANAGIATGLVSAAFGLFALAAAAHGHGGRVVGGYGAQMVVLAVLARAGRPAPGPVPATGARRRRPASVPFRRSGRWRPSG